MDITFLFHSITRESVINFLSYMIAYFTISKSDLAPNFGVILLKVVYCPYL